MNILPFKLERYFAKYEFTAPYLLSSSDCEPMTLKELLSSADGETLKLWNLLSLGYTESQGHPELREEIAKLYQGITSQNIMVMAPEEGIFITMNVLLEKNDEIITTFPAYQSLYEVARSLGCKIKHWKPQFEKKWDFNLSDLEKLISSKTKMLVINFPHNPTGTTISSDELEQILELAKKNNIIIFSDEMYKYLEYDEKDRLSSLMEQYENSITLCGMSKSFALAGLRIGWLATGNLSWIEKFIQFKDYTTICNSATSEILALIGLRAKEYILKRNLEIIRYNLHELDQFFSKYSALFEWYKPQAGPIAFPRLKINKNVSEFCQDLVEKNGVMLLPAEVYDFEANHFRIGFARKNMPEALEQLELYINGQ
jgi:aspartate/methionine/tyrosine aminotransferase